jgi:hypothetical protein
MTHETVQRPSPLVAAARSLATDAVTAEVVGAWRADDVPCVLLKGPTVASWLYDERRVRTYGDSDLLVAPHALPRARAILAALGFAECPYEDPLLSTHATPWVRLGDGAAVDLHHAIWGAAAVPGRQWDVLRDGYTESMRVGGLAVTVPTLPARALLIAAHAAQHAPEGQEKPREDLRRALSAGPDDLWYEAARLADRLGAVVTLVSGLAQDPRGIELTQRLPYTRTWVMGSGGSRTVALGFERVAREPRMRGRLALTGRTLFPPADTMRWWHPAARRSRGALAAAYAARLARLTLRALPGLAAWYRARPARRS